MRASFPVALGIATLWSIAAAATSPAGGVGGARRMSFHNRLLLNRAAVAGLRTIDVMLAVRNNAIADTSALVERLGGRVRRTDEAVGYLRVELPIDNLLQLVASSAIEAYQISSMSRGTWYRDAQPQRNAEMFRRLEVAPPQVATTASGANRDLPVLSVEASRESGYTADDDAGAGRWLAEHPTFDGRGVTIALLETAQPPFTHPAFSSAKTLDGRDVPKIAGILNGLAPDAPDDTRVTLDTEIGVERSWSRIGGRTYALPRAGTYRFGVFRVPGGVNLVHEFGIVEDLATHEIWIDSNGDADFRDEVPLADVNERFDPRMLKVSAPRPADLSFVMARANAPHTIHIYTGTQDHQAATASVAAGSRVRDSLAYGVAPNARILLVRNLLMEDSLAAFVEGYLEAAKRPDVDILDDSNAVMVIPDTSADFLGLVFQRLIGAYRKPIVHAASNMQLFMNSAVAMDGFSVGGAIGPRTFAALYGGGKLDDVIVETIGGAGPSIDGQLKPDFLAPTHRIAADLPWNTATDPLPKNEAAARLPPGYMITCCTSAASPYAAGVIALLISAAKQEHIPYTLESLGRALRLGARFLAGVASHEQGNGVLDVNAAWRELRHPFADLPRIVANADVVHPLAQYAANGHRGHGIFELQGWTAGTTGRRDVRLKRESGPSEPIGYRLSWTGNDGTFTAPASVALPLKATIPVPVRIAVSAAGAHSAILNVHDPSTDAIVFRTQATIVASERFDAATGTVRIGGVLPLMRQRAHYVEVPGNAEAFALELEVLRGTVSVVILPADGLLRNYYEHAFPAYGRHFPKGKYAVVVPVPSAGPWTVSVRNISASVERDPALVSTGEAEYAMTVRLLRGSLRAEPGGDDVVSLDFASQASRLREPVLETSTATLVSHRERFLPTGLANEFEIAVPDAAKTLVVRARTGDTPGIPIELYLYDCTSGECFSYDIAFPAGKSQALIVRRPKAGRWIAAVNAAPFPTADGDFLLDEIIATGTPRRTPVPMNPGESSRARWTQPIDRNVVRAPVAEKTRILFFELLDAAIEREIVERPWENRAVFPSPPGRPVAATTTYRVR